MPQTSTVALIDRDTTTHSFAPRSEADGVFRFVKPNASGVPIGESVLSISSRETPANRKIRIKLNLPTVVTETVNGVSVPKKSHDNWVDIQFNMSVLSSTDERNLLAGLAASLLDSSQTMIDSVVTDLEALY